MVTTPRLSIGLPVYNGESYLAQAIDSLLSQTYEDFELIISDNASTDGTPEICRTYADQDRRIRLFRQTRNIGMAPNHNFVAARARGELFQFAAYDDLYASDLVQRCVEALDENPEAVLAHSWTAVIDSNGVLAERQEHRLATSSSLAPERFKSVLFERAGSEIYAVVRMDALRRALPERSHHHSDRTLVATLALHGRFVQIPDWLYMRRDHPLAAAQACPGVRARCANMDPRRADRLRNPIVRLYGEYVWALFAAVKRAPLSGPDRRTCYLHLATWLASRCRPRAPHRLTDPAAQSTLALDALTPTVESVS